MSDRNRRKDRLVQTLRRSAETDRCLSAQVMGRPTPRRPFVWAGPLAAVVVLAAVAAPREALAAPQPFAGITLSLASQNDQFAPVLAKLAPEFEAETGAAVKVDIMDYGTLLTKTTADFIGHTKGYDLVTMDIVWSGAYAENGYTVDLTDWTKRDAAEIDVPDIYPVLMASLGGFGGKQVAFPFAGYANILAYRKDLYAAADLAPPRTMQDLVADAMTLNDPAKHVYGFVANGKTGPAGAQDWMQYNAQMGGSILDKSGKPDINSAANVESLKVYKQLFDKAAPPGAADYDWDGREQSFRNGSVANMETWSVGAPGYYDPAQSKVVDTVAIDVAPSAAGLAPQYGVGGWGMAINADIDAKKKEAAWAFIKWLTSPAVHKRFNLEGAGQLSPPQRNDRQGPLGQVPLPARDRHDLRAWQRRLPPAYSAISRDPGYAGHGGQRRSGRQRRPESRARRCAGESGETLLSVARQVTALPFQTRRRLFLAALGAPALVYVLAIGVWPMLQGLWYSLFDYSLIHPARRHFVGFGNYASLLADASFRNALLNTLVFSVTAVGLEFAAGLGIALLLWPESRFNQACLALLLVPVTVTPIAVGLIFKGLLEPDYGAIGYWLAHWGISDPRGLFGSPRTALATLIVVDVWEWTPLMALILLAGLKSLPLDIIEAAVADGATALQRFRLVILPMLLPAVFLALVLRMMDAFRVFDSVYVTTGGGPAGASDTLMMLAVKRGLQFFDIGSAAAIGNVMILCLAAMASVFVSMIRRADRAANGR